MFGYKSPKNIPGLVLWWDAADQTTINDGRSFQGQNVYKFIDKVSGVVLTNFAGVNGPTYSYASVNGKNAIHFPYHTNNNGSLKALSTTSLENISIDVKTIFFVFKPTTTQSGNNTKYALSIWPESSVPSVLQEPVISVRSAGGNNPYTEYSEGSFDIEGARNLFFRNEKSLRFGVKSSTNPDVNALQVLISRTKIDNKISKFTILQENGLDSKQEFYKNDELLFEKYDMSPVVGPFGLSIGSYYYNTLNKTSNAYPLEGYFCEMLYFNRFLEDDEINTIGSYLIRKWDPLRLILNYGSIPITLPEIPPPPSGIGGGGNPGVPVVTPYTEPSVTMDVTQIVVSSNQITNFIIDVTLGSLSITDRGIVYSTFPNTTPTINNNKVSSGSGGGVSNPSMTGLSTATSYYVRAFVTDPNGTYYSSPITLLTTSNIIFSRTTGSTNTITNPVDFQFNDLSNVYQTFWDVQFTGLQSNTSYQCGIIANDSTTVNFATALFKSTNNLTSDSQGQILTQGGSNFWFINLTNAITQLSQDIGKYIYFRAFISVNSVYQYSQVITLYLPSLKFETVTGGPNSGTVLKASTQAPDDIVDNALIPSSVGFVVNSSSQDPYYNESTSTTLNGTFEYSGLTMLPTFTADYGQSLGNTSVRAFIEIGNLKVWSQSIQFGLSPIVGLLSSPTFVKTSSTATNQSGEIRFTFNATNAIGLIYGVEYSQNDTFTPIEFQSESVLPVATTPQTLTVQGYGDFGERRWYRGYVRNSNSSVKVNTTSTRNIQLEDIRFVSFVYDAGSDSFIATIQFNATSGRNVDISILTKRGTDQDPALSVIGFNQRSVATGVSSTNNYTYSILASTAYPLGSGNPILSGESISGRVSVLVEGVRQFSFNLLSATKT
jgi:hypothetical protein